MTDQRHYRRIPFQTEAEILFAEHRSVGDLVEIALRGALVRIADQPSLQVGDQGQIRIGLSNSDLSLSFGVELIHRQDTLYGFLFVDADDASLAHLRRLLELNIGDGEEVDRELSYWLQHPRP